MKKIVFCDIDGTLMNHQGVVPFSAKKAIELARKNGHKVFLCTGRAKAEFIGDVTTIPVDGKIFSAGGYIEIDNKVISESYIQYEDVKKVLGLFELNKIGYCLESPEYMYVNELGKEYFKQMIDQRIKKNPQAKESINAGMGALLEIMKDSNNTSREDINKILFFGSRLSLEELQKELEDKFIVIPMSIEMDCYVSGELMIPTVHKATGIQTVLKYIGAEKEDTFAFGDSRNDKEMLEFVQVGIAMGNAVQELKDIADDVTNYIDEDGIFNSFKKYGLI